MALHWFYILYGPLGTPLLTQASVKDTHNVLRTLPECFVTDNAHTDPFNFNPPCTTVESKILKVAMKVCWSFFSLWTFASRVLFSVHRLSQKRNTRERLCSALQLCVVMFPT